MPYCASQVRLWKRNIYCNFYHVFDFYLHHLMYHPIVSKRLFNFRYVSVVIFGKWTTSFSQDIWLLCPRLKPPPVFNPLSYWVEIIFEGGLQFRYIFFLFYETHMQNIHIKIHGWRKLKKHLLKIHNRYIRRLECYFKNELKTLYPYTLRQACFQRKTTLVINIHICVSCLLSHSPQWGRNLCEVAYDFLHPPEI